MLKHKVYVVGHILLHGKDASTILPNLFSLERKNITFTLQHLTTEQSLSQNRLSTLKHSTIPVKKTHPGLLFIISNHRQYSNTVVSTCI